MRALALWDGPMWLRFYGVDEIREFMCILNKKDRRIIPYQIKDALFSIKFCRKSPNIPDRIR